MVLAAAFPGMVRGAVRGTLRKVTSKLTGADEPQQRKERVDGERYATPEVTSRVSLVSLSPLPLPPLLQSYLDYFKNLTSDISVVQGDFDEFPSPENTVRGVTEGARVRL